MSPHDSLQGLRRRIVIEQHAAPAVDLKINQAGKQKIAAQVNFRSGNEIIVENESVFNFYI